jgi:L-ascorbate metabolism protein UlaG (beta-lactamase superfamily)
MIVFLSVIITIFIATTLFMKQKKFGRQPSGKRLERIKQSKNYREGAFQNLSITPPLAEGVSYFTVLKEFFFGGSNQKAPQLIDNIRKTNLHTIEEALDTLVWFGHSSYFMQIDGKKILVDPVLSGAATPMPFGTRAFKGTDIYKPEDIPEIDYLFLTHDHWDHLDYTTLLKLKNKVNTIFCPLGLGAHLEYWGFDMTKVIESDWNETIDLGNGFIINTTPARHFSGRGFRRNQTLWTSFVLKTLSMKIFIGGDSGYDTHFKLLGEQFGPFDLAILENGQYNQHWKYIHMMPEEFHQAAIELKALRILPVHSSKFALSLHSWDEPLKLVTENNQLSQLNIITPMIGEQVNLQDTAQTFSKWWEGER